MSGVGAPAVRPRPRAWRRRPPGPPPICAGLGPQLCGPAMTRARVNHPLARGP
eukprot:gene16125-biopygen15794